MWTRTSEIAREAGFTTGAVYSTFDGREDSSSPSPTARRRGGASSPRRDLAGVQVRRDEVRAALAQALEADAARRGWELVMPATELASALRGVLNGLGFERAVDGEEFPTEAARRALTAVLDAASTA